MSDLESGRNPSYTPQLAEGQDKQLFPGWLRAWWPALLWACLISVFSTDWFSAEHTSRVIEPALAWLFPAWNESQIHLIHHYIRKSAHFTEYFIFCLLLYRSIRGAGSRWRWSWAMAALLVAAGYAALDEIHQAFVASRSASLFDCLIDSFGAAVALAVLWLWFRWHTSSAQNPPGEKKGLRETW